jgi:hypothetical protein
MFSKIHGIIVGFNVRWLLAFLVTAILFGLTGWSDGLDRKQARETQKDCEGWSCSSRYA